jgi:hypothetical protein
MRYMKPQIAEKAIAGVTEVRKEMHTRLHFMDKTAQHIVFTV